MCSLSLPFGKLARTGSISRSLLASGFMEGVVVDVLSAIRSPGRLSSLDDLAALVASSSYQWCRRWLCVQSWEVVWHLVYLKISPVCSFAAAFSLDQGSVGNDKAV